MRRFALLLMLWPMGAIAEWRALSGAEIEAALSGHRLNYETAWQEFRPSGRTLYNAGQDSWGYWQVREDKYCSQWPPSDLWACYRVEVHGPLVRFVGEAGDVTDATYAD